MSMWRRPSSPAGLIYHCTKLSAPPGQGSPLSQPAPHSLARLLTHRPANLISVHRCFSIRSTQQTSIIQLRHRKAKVSLSGVTYKAAFFPHIRLGFGSTTTTAMAHVSTRLYQPLYTHKPFTWTTYLSNPQAILVLRLDERPFKRENKTLLICRPSEQNQQRRPDGQWNAGLAQTGQSEQLSATALLWAHLGRPKTPSDT